jgi:hypothetical protein
MQIQITPNQIVPFTLPNVKALIASKDDTQHRQIRVKTNGIVFISDDFGNQNLDGILFRLETYSAGNGYLGKEASEDDSHVKMVFRQLNDNWPDPKYDYIDF